MISVPIHVDQIRVLYGDELAVDGVSLKVEPGEFVSLLGPSGSGKTTVLRTIAGFIRPSSGQVRVGNQDITNHPPRRRNFGMVFQGYALFPHMTVHGNVAFGLRARHVPRSEADRLVRETLQIVGLEDFSKRYPAQLSGGQQQRVALARAIVIRPQLLLMDEPLAALDLKMRQQLQGEIRRVQTELGISTIYITHDQEEALSLSDRILVMNDGKVVSSGTAEEVYHRPSSRFAAAFVGNKTVFAVPPEAIREDTIVGLPGQLGPLRFDPRPEPGRPTLTVVVEPEHIQCHTDRVPGADHGVVIARRVMGSASLLSIKLDDQVIHAVDKGLGLGQLDDVYVTWSPDSAFVVQEQNTASVQDTDIGAETTRPADRRAAIES